MIFPKVKIDFQGGFQDKASIVNSCKTQISPYLIS